jgi:copper/silver efflux system protein
MLAAIVGFSARHHRAVLAGALVLGVVGARARHTLSRDVLPDVSDPQIVLVADWMGHSATEVANLVTGPLTAKLDGLPGTTAVRGSSMPGMAFLDVVFARSANVSAGRAAILDRVAEARRGIPGTVRIQVGPPASSTSWIFQYLLTDPSHGTPPLALRRLQDDLLAPSLASIPGVAEVASLGGAADEVLVEAQPERLADHAVAFSDLVATLVPALRARPGASLAELEQLPLAGPAPDGAEPLHVSDVARIQISPDAMTSGLADYGGTSPAVGGIVVAQRGADIASIVEGVRAALARARTHLPRGVQLITVYDRLDLTAAIERTLLIALAEEVAVVVLVALAFLLHLRSAALPLVTLPAVVALTFAAMAVIGLPATLMSLSGIGIALGMAVDADVVALEACHRRLEALEAGTASERRAALVEAAGTFAPAILTSLLIAGLTFLPVFAFTDETGRLLRPLALAKTLVVAAAAIVSVTLAPALRDRLLRGRVRPEFANPLTRRLVSAYRPFVHFALTRPVLTLATAALAVASCLPIIPRLGREFLPRVDEGDLLFMPTTLAGAPAHVAGNELRRQDQAISQFREVATVFGKIGRADSATDPAPYTMIETTIQLLPRSQWPRYARTRWYSSWAPPALRRVLSLLWPEESPATTAELIQNMDRATRLPGWTGAWTAPVRARMDMMSTGVRTPLAIRIHADDAARLDTLGRALRAIAAGVPGARSATFEALGGETRLAFALDEKAAAERGVDPALARSTADPGRRGRTDRRARGGGTPPPRPLDRRVRPARSERRAARNHDPCIDRQPPPAGSADFDGAPGVRRGSGDDPRRARRARGLCLHRSRRGSRAGRLHRARAASHRPRRRRAATRVLARRAN